jgi:hypothetical protein
MLFSETFNIHKTEADDWEEVQLLREGIGADRISDATAWLIRSRLAAYTEEICKKRGIATEERRYIRGQYSSQTKQWAPLKINVPINPEIKIIYLQVLRFDGLLC